MISEAGPGTPVNVNVYRSPPIANESPWPEPRSFTKQGAQHSHCRGAGSATCRWYRPGPAAAACREGSSSCPGIWGMWCTLPQQVRPDAVRTRSVSIWPAQRHSHVSRGAFSAR